MNVLFVVLDTVRKDRLSPYNSDVDFTGNIGDFAGDATVFEDAVAQAPWTLPSHASMFTGLYPWEHNATQKNLYLETDRELLAERFQDAGYRTACYTSNTWLSPYTGMTEGFDDIDNFFPVLPSDLLPAKLQRFWERLNTGRARWVLDRLMDIGDRFHQWFESSGRSSKTEDTLAKAEEFMREDGEFFLFLNLMDAHEPYYPLEEYRERHAPDVNPDDVCQIPGRYYADKEDADFDAISRLYDAEMDYLDDKVGELLAFMDEHDLMEDTIIVITADHGQDLGENGRYGHQFTVSEETVAVPLIIRADGLEDGRRDEQVELRELYDLVPQLAGIAETGEEPGTEYAKGGYAYPQLDLRNMPAEKKEAYGKELAFARGDGQKAVREENGGTVVRGIDLATGDGVEPSTALLDALDMIGSAEEGSGEIGDEQVKERLEDLGYL